MNAPAGDISGRLSPALRTEALEQLLVERELIDPAVMDKFIKTYEQDVGPLNGAKVVARAWTDPEYREWLLRDGTAAIKDMGYGGPQGEHMVVVEQSDDVHHVVVCTLCSCYPWPVLGLPPNWYKDPQYRAAITREPRKVLRESFGFTVPDDVEVRVWDSSSEMRYWVLPQRPAGTEGWNDEQLLALVTRDAMIGVGPVGAVA